MKLGDPQWVTTQALKNTALDEGPFDLYNSITGEYTFCCGLLACLHKKSFFVIKDSRPVASALIVQNTVNHNLNHFGVYC